MSPRYNLSAAVKIYRRHRRMTSSSASQKDYRLVLLLLLLCDPVKQSIALAMFVCVVSVGVLIHEITEKKLLV